MDARDFCYWLNGFAEIAQPSGVDDTQWSCIVEHLDLVDLNLGADTEECIDAVLQIRGFVSVTSKRTPSPGEWQGIVQIVTNCFEKITNSGKQSPTGTNVLDDLADRLKEFTEKRDPNRPANPWGPVPVPQYDAPWSPEPDCARDGRLICSTVQEERHDRLSDEYAGTPSYKLGEHSQGYENNT